MLRIRCLEGLIAVCPVILVPTIGSSGHLVGSGVVDQNYPMCFAMR